MTGFSLFSNIDVRTIKDIEALSAIRQEITHHILIQANGLNLPCDNPRVITLVLTHFYRLVPTCNLCVMRMVERLAKASEESRP